MPTPEFILRLREQVGHEPLWLVGVTAVVVRGEEVLLVKRSDTGEWTPVAGIVEPGEHTATTAVREVLEEARVDARVERLAGVSVSREYRYPNGDRTQYTNLTYRLAWVSGDPTVGDEESTDVGWFSLHALPPIPDRYLRRIGHALENRADAVIDLAPED